MEGSRKEWDYMVNLPLESIVGELVAFANSPRRIWLFGSRRHGDALPGSDIDLIVDASDGARQLNMEGLQEKYHGFVDVFALRGDRAASLSNDCYLECEGSAPSLLKELGAVLVWQAETGWVGRYRDLTFAVDLTATPSVTNVDGVPRISTRGGLLKM
jgi:hypothetical protein